MPKYTVVLLPLKGSEDRESVALSTNPRFLAMLERSEARLKREGALSVGDVRRRLAARRARVRRAHSPRPGT